MCVLAFGALFGAGCAMSATASVVRAGTTVETAEHADANTYAIYEYTKARQYLHKAREEYGYQDYEAAAKFADEAQSWAEKALEKARDRPTGGVVPRSVTPGQPVVVPATGGQ